MKKGSITIFSLLSMMLVASTLFSLLEASRFHEIQRLAQLQTKVALESVFAEYNTYLWEEYRLLACKQSEIVCGLEEGADNRQIDNGFGTNFFQFRVSDVKLDSYTRLTDGDGIAFIQAVKNYMEKNLLYETAKELYGQYEGIKNMQTNSGYDFSQIDSVLNKLKEEESSVGTTGTMSESSESDTATETAGNPLEIIQNLQRKGVLSLVLEDTSQLSEKKIDMENTVSNRQLLEEHFPNLEEVDWYSRVLLQQYLLTYMSFYTDEKNHVMSYEVEYLLGGRDTEIENMKIVVTELLGIRGAANFLYLASNTEKMEQARLLAVAIAGTSLNPVVIEAVKNAILIAWAFAESVLDVRALLTGNRIALLKSDTTWTMDLDAIGKLGEGYMKAENCENGLNYKDYLGILLLFKQENLLAKRSMDVQELTLRDRYDNTEIYLDEWIIDVKTTVTYGYHPVFFSVHRIIPYWKYEVKHQEVFGY